MGRVDIYRVVKNGETVLANAGIDIVSMYTGLTYTEIKAAATKKTEINGIHILWEYGLLTEDEIQEIEEEGKRRFAFDEVYESLKKSDYVSLKEKRDGEEVWIDYTVEQKTPDYIALKPKRGKVNSVLKIDLYAYFKNKCIDY